MQALIDPRQLIVDVHVQRLHNKPQVESRILLCWLVTALLIGLPWWIGMAWIAEKLWRTLTGN